MKTTSLHVALSPALIALLAVPSAVSVSSSPQALPYAPDELTQPPGVIAIRGGRFPTGAEEEFVVQMIEANEGVGKALASELGGKPMSIADFCLMPTEVTNEQYAAFVRATDSRPPQSWADPEALETALTEFNKEQGEKVRAARENGDTYERKTFNTSSWYDKNWESLEWVVPTGQETHPVTWIDHSEARAYAEWAGLRLMTEFEFQAAGRGKKKDPFPWGEEWDNTKAVSLSSYRSQIQAAGSTGYATDSGLHDLVGNVWEWTDSPFRAYEDYEDIEVTFGKGKRARTETFRASFDANNRVAVGGSADFDEAANHLTVRRNTDRGQRTEKLGFRCAATPGPAVDFVQAGMRRANAALRPAIALAPDFSLSLQRWKTSKGSADIAGYAVIEDYQAFSITPVEKIEASSMAQLTNITLAEGPIEFAVLNTTVPIVEPPMPPGTYKLSWRGKGADRSKGDEEEEGETEEPELPYDTDEINLLISNRAGEIVAIYDGSDAKITRRDKKLPGGKLELFPYEAPEEEPEEGVEPEPALDTLDVTLDIPGRKTKDVVRFVFGFRLAEGTIDESWLGVGSN